jgi:hypothetical protein
MAVPCCPKCGKTHFLRSKNGTLKVTFVYCGACGAVVSAIPIRKSSGGTTTGKGGTTSQDDWEG